MVHDHDNHMEPAALENVAVVDSLGEGTRIAEADNSDDGPVQPPELEEFHEHHTALVEIPPPSERGLAAGSLRASLFAVAHPADSAYSDRLPGREQMPPAMTPDGRGSFG